MAADGPENSANPRWSQRSWSCATCPWLLNETAPKMLVIEDLSNDARFSQAAILEVSATWQGQTLFIGSQLGFSSVSRAWHGRACAGSQVAWPWLWPNPLHSLLQAHASPCMPQATPSVPLASPCKPMRAHGIPCAPMRAHTCRMQDHASPRDPMGSHARPCAPIRAPCKPMQAHASSRILHVPNPTETQCVHDPTMQTMGIHSYLSSPLVSSTGYILGSICVMGECVFVVNAPAPTR